jgi:hypothetical protein
MIRKALHRTLFAVLAITVLEVAGPVPAWGQGASVYLVSATFNDWTPGNTLRCNAQHTAAILNQVFSDENGGGMPDVIADAVRRVGFGSFSVRPRAARSGELTIGVLVDALPPFDVSPEDPFGSTNQIIGDSGEPSSDMVVFVEVRRTDTAADSAAPGESLFHLSCSDIDPAGNTVSTVRWFNASKGYGFIQPEDGSID